MQKEYFLTDPETGDLTQLSKETSDFVKAFTTYRHKCNSGNNYRGSVIIMGTAGPLDSTNGSLQDLFYQPENYSFPED